MWEDRQIIYLPGVCIEIYHVTGGFSFIRSAKDWVYEQFQICTAFELYELSMMNLFANARNFESHAAS